MAYKFLHGIGYRNTQILEGGIPGWHKKGYPVEGERVGVFDHQSYSRAAREFERRLRSLVPSG